MWTTVVCKIVELDEWSLCSPSAKGILMYLPVELGRYVLKSGWVTAYTYGMEFISKGGVKISDICGEMNPLDIFCIGRSEFGFHLDGEINRDG